MLIETRAVTRTWTQLLNIFDRVMFLFVIQKVHHVFFDIKCTL